MVLVKNLRDSKPRGTNDFIVDHRSPLGNPFYLNGEAHRDEVCDKYEKHFQGFLLSHPPAIRALECMKEEYKRIGKVRLFCWCAPKRCHADTIARWIMDQV